MKVVNIIGGLGNQMFQYAFAVAMSNRYPKEVVKIDTQLYRFPIVKKYKGNNFYHNGFEIKEVFTNATLPIASFLDLTRVSLYIPNYFFNKIVRRVLKYRKSEYVQNYRQAYVFDPNIYTSNASYFDGYWMNPAYFDFCRDEILKAFSFSEFDTEDNRTLAKMMASDNSVTIHIRRGDYVGAENFKDICTLSYYRNAINEVKLIIKNPNFFIFSNDQEWCMENLKDEFGESKVYFVSNNKGKESYRDLQLMSLARCNILANSSFSWWGAYLNQRSNHIVFCPERWVNNLECKDLILCDWQKINIL